MSAAAGMSRASGSTGSTRAVRSARPTGEAESAKARIATEAAHPGVAVAAPAHELAEHLPAHLLAVAQLLVDAVDDAAEVVRELRHLVVGEAVEQGARLGARCRDGLGGRVAGLIPELVEAKMRAKLGK